MNDGTLIRKSLFRKKTRAILLILSIMTAFLIFGLLGSFARVFTAGADSAAADRLVTVNKINFTLSMPYAYYGRIGAIEGVQSITHASWFGGYYQEPVNFLQAFAVNMDQYFVVYDELVVVEGSLEDTLARRDCVAVGRALADQYDFTLGQRFPLSSNIWQRTDGGFAWEVDVCSIFDVETGSSPTNFLLLDYEYFNESRAFGEDEVGWMILRTGDPERNDSVSQEIDLLFANSRAETETTTEAAFGAAFLEQFGNIALILTLSVSAAFATILMIVGTTMVMAGNERRRDVAVMKTLGFSAPRIFGHVIGETVLLSLLGGLLGLGLAALAIFGAGEVLSASFPGLAMPTDIVLYGLAIMLGFGLVTGLAPALSAMRLNIVDGLGKE
jgi:putative ABC transport system permease protein